MKIICVCGFCGEHVSDEVTIELNFRDHIIYFFCFKCKKENKIELKPPSQPLPKMKMRR
jgi:hypothetical protein